MDDMSRLVEAFANENCFIFIQSKIVKFIFQQVLENFTNFIEFFHIPPDGSEFTQTADYRNEMRRINHRLDRVYENVESQFKICKMVQID